ncbi:MAG: hypothetical protein V7735_12900 [Photobacterium frigidiphilum]|uniref:hypothetical protein n=1 Tax=Photobacterium frigidiphilum TaxID=264736 RepID=UPI003003649A
MSSEERIRQQKVTERRKASGFKTKKCHFFKRDLNRLDRLAKDMGYDTSKLSNEDYTSIIRSCIAEKYARMHPEKVVNVPDNQEEQYLYELKQIISFRMEEKDTANEIAQFMQHSNYPVPVSEYEALANKPENTHPEWCEGLVEALSPNKK